MSAGLKANADGSAAIQVGGSDAITITSGLVVSMNGGAVYPITSGTAVTVSGTSVDFTGIPSTAKRVTVMLSGVSTNSTGLLMLQLGDAGGVETSGYAGGYFVLRGGAVASTTALSAGVTLSDSSAAVSVYAAQVVFTLLSGNIWTFSGICARTDTASGLYTAGTKTLSDTLDRVRLTTNTGTDTFDAGTINILWE
jgi:hypothetical protein